jgi:hypothetical protein
VIIAAFVKAQNDRDTNAVVACFDDQAVVRDEGREMHGLAEIREWSEGVFNKFRFTLDPHGMVERGEEKILSATLTGDFPGSPVSLDFNFTIQNNRIARLTIA